MFLFLPATLEIWVERFTWENRKGNVHPLHQSHFMIQQSVPILLFPVTEEKDHIRSPVTNLGYLHCTEFLAERAGLKCNK